MRWNNRRLDTSQSKLLIYGLISKKKIKFPIKKNITDAIYSMNLQSVGSFLENCVQDYKIYDQTMFTMIYQHSLFFVQNVNRNM